MIVLKRKKATRRPAGRPRFTDRLALTVTVAYHDNQLVFEEVLNDVADLIQISNIDRIVFGGDFNTALSQRASTHTRSLNQFVTNESLSFLSALSCYEVDYTHESDAHGTRSTLDHFIVSSLFRTPPCPGQVADNQSLSGRRMWMLIGIEDEKIL
ncbi:hypothetical protein CAPTEDRAFT_195428 [Capitella teleta]|uniref:Endonuclease/exonuclease/phosphatase domain-containing protein n=1 Tax=Capitella teleta TaxID=283909 RepID=R7VDB0_CAPTE|nr:hypothetical protein CAPTEDRAFT_195428 [Capitella teleta]|eukprot:ELU16818.1 hypothetical protein CAPTEDRAFT_195428 [Capitella teleta]